MTRTQTSEKQAFGEFEREKWLAEHKLREREIGIKEREEGRSRWTNPLVIAIFAAAVAAIGNATVAWLNGLEQRNLERTRAQQAQVLEETKAEASRILEVIRTLNPDKAAANLKFLLNAGLISDSARRKNIQAFLEKHPSLSTPTLPPLDRPEVSEACKRYPNLC